MKILGLTGSIGMGKSTAAAMVRRMGIPVHDADQVVHQLLDTGGAAVPLIATVFPDAVKDGKVDRACLGAHVFSDRPALARLESLLHPLVRQAEQRFLQRARASRKALTVLDIPLLFETNGESRCDAVALICAPPFLQSLRVLRRPGMTPEKLAGIRLRQTSEREKKRRADFLAPSSLGRRETLRRLIKIIAAVLSKSPYHKRRLRPSCRRRSHFG